MSAYRDKAGRFRKRTGLDILDEIGALLALPAIIWGTPYLIGYVQALEVIR